MVHTALCAELLCCASLVAAPPGAPVPTAAEMREKARWVTTALEDGEPPFSFTYGHRSSRELLPGWRVGRASEETTDARHGRRMKRTLTYTDPETGLVARCAAVEYSDYPTVEWTLSLRNDGVADTPILSDVRALDMRLDRGAEGEFVLRQIHGDNCTPQSYEPLVTELGTGQSLRVANDGGRGTNGAFPYVNIGWQDAGVLCVLGWPGQWDMGFLRDAASGLSVRGGQEGTSFVLHPGEEIRCPLVVLQFYRGDWLRAQNVWRRWMLAHNIPQPGGRPIETMRSVCNGSYYPGMRDDAENELRMLRRHIEENVGFDLWWQDAGWYPCGQWGDTGTWEVDAARFPRGLREVTDHAHAQGKRTILWVEPERVVAGTWLAENHPEWILGGRGGGLLNLGVPECRKWLVDHVDRLMTEQGIDDYRQDFNMDPLAYWRGADAPDRQGITEIRHVEGYLAFWDELARRRPGMLIDSCASGGRRNDLETLRRAVPLLRSDCCTPAEGQQCQTWGLSLWVPYQGTAYLYEVDTYWARSATVASLLTGAGPDGIDNIDWEHQRDIMEEHRRLSPYTLGDFYPLTPYSLALGCWMAFQFDRPDLGSGMVEAFRRPESASKHIRLKLRGLDPSAEYELTDLDSGKVTLHTGASLMRGGLWLTASVAPSSVVIEYRRR